MPPPTAPPQSHPLNSATSSSVASPYSNPMSPHTPLSAATPESLGIVPQLQFVHYLYSCGTSLIYYDVCIETLYQPSLLVVNWTSKILHWEQEMQNIIQRLLGTYIQPAYTVVENSRVVIQSGLVTPGAWYWYCLVPMLVWHDLYCKPVGLLYTSIIVLLVAFCCSDHEDKGSENNCSCIQFWQNGMHRSQEVSFTACELLVNQKCMAFTIPSVSIFQWRPIQVGCKEVC